MLSKKLRHATINKTKRQPWKDIDSIVKKFTNVTYKAYVRWEWKNSKGFVRFDLDNVNGKVLPQK